MNEITVNDVLKIIKDEAQWCRENGESDMRNILNAVNYLQNQIDSGKSREEILVNFERD